MTVEELNKLPPAEQVLYWLGYIKQEALTPGLNPEITTRAMWGMIEDIARTQRKGGNESQ